jgi:hypothetical protein
VADEKLVPKFASPEYVALIVNGAPEGAAEGNDATQTAVVFEAAVLTVLGAHKLTGVMTMLLV